MRSSIISKSAKSVVEMIRRIFRLRISGWKPPLRHFLLFPAFRGCCIGIRIQCSTPRIRCSKSLTFPNYFRGAHSPHFPHLLAFASGVKKPKSIHHGCPFFPINPLIINGLYQSLHIHPTRAAALSLISGLPALAAASIEALIFFGPILKKNLCTPLCSCWITSKPA